jgi:hypothetical protein
MRAFADDHRGEHLQMMIKTREVEVSATGELRGPPWPPPRESLVLARRLAKDPTARTPAVLLDRIT